MHCIFVILIGGNFSNLLDKYLYILINTKTQKEKQKEESLSSKIVLGVLIVINMYMLYSYIYQNNKNLEVMLNTLPGKLIININVVSYILIFYILLKINKMEE
jgi:hypothetical protein